MTAKAKTICCFCRREIDAVIESVAEGEVIRSSCSCGHECETQFVRTDRDGPPGSADVFIEEEG